MARRVAAPEPRPANLTPEQMRQGIERLLKRLAEVSAFDPSSVTEQHNIPHVEALAASVDESLVRTFGAESLDYNRYRDAALTILQTLCSERFLAQSRPEWEGILLHAVYQYHKGLGVNESVAWGDHFFVESLVKVLAGKSEAGW